jgi:hypothetical protein
MFGFTSVKDSNSMPGGSLLGDPRPEGFDERGRNVLIEVGEFRLVEMWRPGGSRVVEYSAGVQAAFDRAYFCVSDAERGVTTPAERVKMAQTMHAMVEAVLSGTPANAAAKALGREVLIAMHDDDVEEAIRSLANKFLAALRSEAIARGRMRDKYGKLRKLKWEAVAIIEGGKIFERTGKLPKQRTILKALRAQGYAPPNRKAERALLNRAKLGNLPW